MRRSLILLLLCCASCSFSVLSTADVEPTAHDQQFPHSTHEGDTRTPVRRRTLSTVGEDVLSETPVESSLVSLHSYSESSALYFCVKVRDGERILLQSEGLDAASEPERECSLRRVDIRRYLDESSRTWTIDDDVLDAIDSDVQSLVDCTNEGDALLFDSTKIIRPSARVVLPWPLTLSAFVEHAELEEGVFPKAVKKATFACPRDNEGVFLVRTGGSFLANLEFEGCSFGESGEKKAIIEVEGCASALADRTLLLHHVSFKENRLVDAAGVWVHSTSCLALDMRNVEFSDNQCSSSGCGAILSSDNRIEDFTARRNRLTEEHDRQPSVLNAPTGSKTVANGVRAVRNDLSAMHVVEGSLSLTNSTCSHNSVEAFDDEEPFGACIHLVRSTATVQNSGFEENEGYWGGSVSVQSSNVSLEDSEFRNGRAQKGGVLFAETDSAVSIERCSFTDNEASEHGGVGFVDSSSLSMIDSVMSGNSAMDDGGSLRVTDSELAVEACHFQNGSASKGGFIHIRRTLANVRDSEFERGTAATQGGCIATEQNSQLMSQNDIFRSSSARLNGGVASAHQNSSLSFINATFVSNTARGFGHCIGAETSHIFTKQSLVANNTGLGNGAFLGAANHSRAEIVETTFLHNSADFGGVVVLQTMSSVEVHRSLFSGNAAAGGGGSFYSSSDCTISIHLCQFNNGTAGNGGGFILSSDGDIRISSSYFSNGTAHLGGCIGLSPGTRMTVENSTIAFCRAQDDGGAVDAVNSTMAVRNIIVANSTSASGAGGIRCSAVCRMSAANSSFEANSGMYGGAMTLIDKSVATVTGCRFLGNTAQRSGASVYVDASNASLSHCIFTNGSAAQGGALTIYNSARVSLSDSSISHGMSGSSGGGIDIDTESAFRMRNVLMENNTSLQRGGAISAADSSTVRLKNSRFLGNQARTFGGAVFMLSGSELTGDGLIFDENSAQDGHGGSIVSFEPSKFHILNSRFSRGNAKFVGGIVIRRSAMASVFVNCSFESNTALLFGGVCLVMQSAARFENCSMVGNSAVTAGGSLSVVNSTVDLLNTHFSGNNGTDSGGFIEAVDNSEIRGHSVSMVETSSENGGALWFRDSVIQLENAHFSRCHANESGGVVFGSKNSSFLCNNCIFENNTARRWGGAMYLNNVSSHSVSVQIDGSTFRNNTAAYGGAISFLRESDQANCTIQDDNCSFLALTDTVFSENEAKYAGGAILASDIDSIRISCSRHKRWQSRSEFSDRAELETLDALRSTADICQSWKGNQAGVYADDVGSSGAGVRMTVIPDNLNGAIEETLGNRFVVEGHSSGEPLPTIQLKVVDGLGQGPAAGVNSLVIEATMTSPDGLFSGSVNIEMNEGVGNFSGVVGFGPEGVYECIIDFSEELIESLVVEVHIRGCRLGEVAAANGTVCEPCTADTYNLMPGNGTGCHPCPENGDCTTHVILPAKGYWHATPCSENIQECISSDACSSEEREVRMAATTRNISSCEFDEEFEQNYTEAQCREGHEGPLCGSCKASHGKTHSSLCEKCFTGFSNYALIFVSFLVLLALSYVTVRSNTISTSNPRRKSARSIRQLKSLPNRSSSVPVNEEMVEMMVTGRVPQELLHPELQPAQGSKTRAEDAELAKWKTAELFKIMVNFLQVTAVAIAINVKWTLMMIALFEGAEFISGITSEAVNRSVDCIVPDDASVDRSIASVIIDSCLPLGVICVFSIIWLAIKVKRGEPWSYLLKKIILTAIAVLYISYISLTKTLVSILDCVEVHDSVDSEIDVTSDYWSTDTKIECYKGPHALLAFMLGWPFLIVFSFGFPLITACLIVRNVEEDYTRGWIYKTCGFLYRSYKKNYVFWESVVMFRKAILAVIVVFSYPLGANLQHVLVVLLFLFVLYLQMMCCPYRPEFDSLNKMESLSILVSAMTFGSSMFFGDEHVSSTVRILITVGLAFCNIALFLLFLFVFVIFAADYLRIVLDQEGVPYKPDGGAHHILWIYFHHYLFERVKNAVHKLFFGALPSSL